MEAPCPFGRHSQQYCAHLQEQVDPFHFFQPAHDSDVHGVRFLDLKVHRRDGSSHRLNVDSVGDDRNALRFKVRFQVATQRRGNGNDRLLQRCSAPQVQRIEDSLVQLAQPDSFVFWRAVTGSDTCATRREPIGYRAKNVFFLPVGMNDIRCEGAHEFAQAQQDLQAVEPCLIENRDGNSLCPQPPGKFAIVQQRCMRLDLGALRKLREQRKQLHFSARPEISRHDVQRLQPGSVSRQLGSHTLQCQSDAIFILAADSIDLQLFSPTRLSSWHLRAARNLTDKSMMAHWYSHGDLPPTGNLVLLQQSAPSPQFRGYSSAWVNSGTAALALALMMARDRHPGVKTPAVVLPAYGCPDLVAAAEFAQVRPVLVDIGADDPAYSLTSLQRALTPDVVAVVAVNFLGIRERLAQLKNLLATHSRALLIEDNAQWFPEPPDDHALVGDLVCLSFGRGKPVSLLGGGALLVRQSSDLEVPRQLIGAAQESGSLFSLKVHAFNTLLNRRWYWLINRNPVFSVGQTIFKPLVQVSALDTVRSRILGANVAAYLSHRRDIEAKWRAALSSSATVVPVSAGPERNGRLLRYPVLCRDASMRDALVARLHRAGVGASAMYRCPLAQVSGVGNKVQVIGNCTGASAFAARLITLPTHQQTSSQDVDNAAALLA